MKHILIRVTLVLMAIISPILAAGPAAAQQARTFIDELHFETPEGAVDAFVAKYRARDYLSVWFMLSAEAKLGFIESWQRNFHAREIFPDLTLDIIPGTYFDLSREHTEMDGLVYDSGRIFDDIMYGADRLLVMPFWFGNSAKIIENHTEGDTARVTVDPDGKPNSLTIELTRVDSGAPWRVDRVRWDGSSATLRPWGKELEDKG